MEKLDEIHEIYRDYCSGSQPLARFLMIYIEESSDGKGSLNSAKPISDFHYNLSDRLAAANRFVEETGWTAGEVVCDTMKNEALYYYDAHPERIIIIQDGIVVHDGGKGPVAMVHYDLEGIFSLLFPSSNLTMTISIFPLSFRYQKMVTIDRL